MTPDPDKQARDRLAILLGLRAGGGVLIAIGLWMVLGGSFAGAYGFGWVLLAVGAAEMMIVPKLLARAWRTPR